MTRLAGFALVLAALSAPTATAAAAEPVEPSDLARRPELVGREVVVDDRVRYFLESRRGQGFDELLLRRTEVPFRIPPRLRPGRSPSEPSARVVGTLKLEEGRLVCLVSAIEMLPNDLDRLEKELGKLRPDDFAGRRAWALWAERRGRELPDPKLEARGVELEGEALWSEAARPDADHLALAARSSSRPIPENVRDALAHRGFRDRLARAKGVDELDALARKIEAALPRSVDPKAPSPPDSTLAAYEKDPAAAYRDAPDPGRAGLDRRLLVDARRRWLEEQVEARPGDAAGLAEKAREQLPDRPEVADRLRKRGLGEAEGRVASMRQSEVEDLARTFREGGEEERARQLFRSWLGDRRKNRLSGTDAEGRILLAGNYARLLGDRATAGDLLREALAIDPGSKGAVDALLRLGFRKGDAGWFDPEQARAAGPDPAARGEAPAPGNSLLGLTRAQVRARLGGKPDRVVRSATQGRCVEHWIYGNGKGMQVIGFLFEPGTTEPRASSFFVDQR